jgi:polyketide synthase PksN
MDGYSATASVPSIGPNRMSYLLNLRGPSEPIETACSSSLVAVIRGVSVLRDGSCDLAIVGGINTIITPEAHISFNKAGMLSPDGRCKPFAQQANGYARGEGVGMLVLKRLSDAEEAGDHIHGVILGCAENHGGRATSLTAPNPQAQAELLRDAYRRAGIDPRTISYVEAHGTGTRLGDPVEIAGLKAAFGESGEQGFCGLGSVKSNIGHLELAAGVAGMLKVLLQMRHKTLVKSLHSEQLNPYFDLADSPFYVVQQTAPWLAQRDAQGHPLPRRAGVSSFGFGGVNAHVLLEEYLPSAAPPVATDRPALIVLSARNEERLLEVVSNLLAFLNRAAEPGPAWLASLACTLQLGRDAMEERLAWSVTTVTELIGNLQAFVARGALGGGMRGQVKRHKEALSVLAADEDAAVPDRCLGGQGQDHAPARTVDQRTQRRLGAAVRRRHATASVSADLSIRQGALLGGARRDPAGGCGGIPAAPPVACEYLRFQRAAFHLAFQRPGVVSGRSPGAGATCPARRGVPGDGTRGSRAHA